MARKTLLMVLLILLLAAPAQAQDGLTVIDPADITGFIEDGAGEAATMIFVNNEGGAVSGRLTVTTLLKASSPEGYRSSPLCLVVQVDGGDPSACLPSVANEISFDAGRVTAIRVTIRTVTCPPTASCADPLPMLQYGEATLITVFNQDTTTGQTPVTDPLTLSDYRKVFFVPSLYTADAMAAAAVFSLIFLAAALVYLFIAELDTLKKKWLWHPLGEVAWGAQSSTALLTSLASTAGVIAISGGAAGINLTTFNTSAYTLTIATLGVFFSALPIIGGIVYRLSGWRSGGGANSGTLLGYTIASGLTLFALVGSVLISSNVIQVVLLSTLGIADPTQIPVYLLVATGVSFAFIVVIGLHFIHHFRSDVSAQIRAQREQALRTEKENTLLALFESEWKKSAGHETAVPALLALQTLADYDLPIPVAPKRDPSETLRSVQSTGETSTAYTQSTPSSRRESSVPKMRI